MDILTSVFLGIIQGLTEFLPISSSGHLVIFQNFLGLKEPEIFFDVCLHMGTLLAILIYYFQKIKTLCVSCFDFKNFNITTNKNLSLVAMIIIGSIPTAVIGLLIKKYCMGIFADIGFAGLMLIITSIILSCSFFIKEKGEKDIKNPVKKALAIGVIQGLAVFPGISRSGSTIVTGLFLGLNKEDAAEFSFLLSIPAVAGAQLLAIADVSKDYIAANLLPVLLGSFASFLTGYLALIFLIRIVKKGKLYFFAPYCFIAGAVCIAVSLT